MIQHVLLVLNSLKDYTRNKERREGKQTIIDIFLAQLIYMMI
jgi:hypothetical protein